MAKQLCTYLLPCTKKLTGKKITAASRDGKSLIASIALFQPTRNTSKMWRRRWPGLGPMRSGETGCQGAGGTWEPGWWPRGERSRQKTGWKVTFGSVHLANIETYLKSRHKGWWRSVVGSWRKVFSVADWIIYNLTVISLAVHLLSILHHLSLDTA